MTGPVAASCELLVGLYALESGAIGLDQLVAAIRTRSRASESAWSARPTRSMRTWPGETSAWMLTR